MGLTRIYSKFSTELYEVHYLVPEVFHGKRLDEFLKLHFSSFSRNIIKNKIIKGDIIIDGRQHLKHKPSSKIYKNEVIKILTYKENYEDEYWKGEKVHLLPPEVIAETDDILCINKPPFMSTHPTGKHLFYTCTTYYETLLGSSVHSVHRLDRETSGILILGKNPKASNRYTIYFDEKKVKKVYFFISHIRKQFTKNFWANERMGSVENFIPQTFTHCFPENSQEGKSASTFFKISASDDQYAVGLAFPISGRQHQIRAHASFHGLPLVGDKLYAHEKEVFMRFKDKVTTEEDYKKMIINRHALHALAIKVLPTKEFFQTKIPTDLKDFLLNYTQMNFQEIEEKINDTLKSFQSYNEEPQALPLDQLLS